MPQKKAEKKRREKIFFSKRFSQKISVFSILLFFVLLEAKAETFFSILPHFTLPLGKEKHSIKYGLGAGAKLSFAPKNFLELGLYGDFYNFVIPISEVDSIFVFEGGIFAGYVLPIKERFGLNFGANFGMYKAMRSNSLTGFDLGFSMSLLYKARPAVYVGAGASFSHYAAGNTALINGLEFSPEIKFNFTEAFKGKAKVKMETLEILPVFPVLYSWYESNRFATVSITNEESGAIGDIKVSFFQPQYMGHPNVCFELESGKKLASGQSLNADLTAFFNERMLEMTEKSDTQATVTVEYTLLGQKKSKEFSMTIPVYGRNSMSWADDRRAAVFVSSKDPAAMLYGKYVASVVRENMRIGVPTNIQYAMGIFDSLAGFGINYVIDPASAYTDNVGTETPDFLQFPYQTLSYRGGDCDDLSILICSFFEAVGVGTAFITIPGHIYMAFDSGLSKKQAQEQFGSLENFIIFSDEKSGKEEVWVPLEITLTDEGFNKAWRVGAREWRVASESGDAAIYRMKDSWQIYKPVSVPGAVANFSMPQNEEIAAAFEAGVNDWILREIGPKISAYKAQIEKNGDLGAQNDLGALYGRYGLFELAKEALSPLSKKGRISSMINYANVLYSKKDFSSAKKLYEKIIRRDKTNALAHLGVARCAYELEDYEECDGAYLKVCELDKDLAASYAYLGAFENATGRAFNLADRLFYTIWKIEGNDDFKTESENLAQIEREYVGLPKQITIPSPDFLLAENSLVANDGESEDEVVELETEDALPILSQIEESNVEVVTDLSEEESSEIESAPAEDAPAKIEPPVLAEDVPPAPIEDAPKNCDAQERLYVCTGSFKFRRYAQFLQDSLQKDGKKSFIEPAFLQSGLRVYRVLLDHAFDSVDDAKKMQEEFSESDFAKKRNIFDAWICTAPVHSASEEKNPAPLLQKPAEPLPCENSFSKGEKVCYGTFMFRRYAQLLQKKLKKDGIETFIEADFLQDGMRIYHVLLKEKNAL